MRRPRRFAHAAILLTLAVVNGGFAIQSSAADKPFDLQTILTLNVGTTLGQCRAAPVDLGEKKGILIAYCEDAEVDPYVEMFFFPKHTMKLMVFALDGTPLWKKEFGPGVIPGIWFTPILSNQPKTHRHWLQPDQPQRPVIPPPRFQPPNPRNRVRKASP